MSGTARGAGVVGVVLAAGEGRRMGAPKALVRDDGGRSWVERAVQVLRAGGCDRVAVAVGARADDVAALVVHDDVTLVDVPDWREGMGASLRTVLDAAGSWPEPPDALLVLLVDLPDVGPAVVGRVLDHAEAAPARTGVLARATYDGRPGHPVLVGRDHWAPMASTLHGDEGGRRYLGVHDTDAIECGDLATGRDQDTPV